MTTILGPSGELGNRRRRHVQTATESPRLKTAAGHHIRAASREQPSSSPAWSSVSHRGADELDVLESTASNLLGDEALERLDNFRR